ncbi:MAG: PHP domain-containing protein [Gemmatimonadales bacterium]
MSDRIRFRPGVTVPFALTAVLAGSRLAAVPELSDPLGSLSPSLHLVAPWPYLLAAPLFTLWDGVSMLSMSRLYGFLAGLAMLYLVWRVARALRRRSLGVVRELSVLILSLAALFLFIAVGALWHRPMLALAGAGPGVAVADFHSHTNLSHDVEGTWMRGYDAESNLRWHRRAGFDAVFITDHNTAQPVRQRPGLPLWCPGTEVSAWRAHVVLLGSSAPVDRRLYNRGLESLLQLLRTSESAYGALSVASLPEYRRNHWDRLDTLASEGLDGFEVVSAAPKANELTRPERDSVIALARRLDRFVVGVSDHHGWGATSMVWNLVRARGAKEGVSRGCGAVLDRLRSGFDAVRIVERHRLRADAWWPMWLTPVGVVWETWRSMGWPATVSWVVWVWVVWVMVGLSGRRRKSAE